MTKKRQHSKRKSPEVCQSFWKTASAFVFQFFLRKVYETVMLGIFQNVSNTRRMKVANFGNGVRFFIQQKVTIASVSSNQKVGCVSQDVELPEQAVGFTTAFRSILKKIGERSPRAHLELHKHDTANFSKLGNS